MTTSVNPIRISLLALCLGLGSAAHAAGPVGAYPGYGYGAPPAYGAPYGGGYPPRGYAPGPAYGPGYGTGYAPGYGSGYGPGYGSGYGPGYGSGYGPGYNRPRYGSGRNFGGPRNNRRGSSGWGPFGNDRNFGDFRNPFRDRDMDDWFSLDRDDMADNWDDVLNAPSRMGTMPGGWEAPSISVPNPVDVGDELGDAARDAPEQMRNLNSDY